MADDEDEILAFKKCYPIEFRPDTKYENLIDYINDILSKMFAKISVSFGSHEIKNCVKFTGEYTTAYTVYKIMVNVESRIEMIDSGAIIWHEFEKSLAGLRERNDELP
jgi:hypothetical protein